MIGTWIKINLNQLVFENKAQYIVHFLPENNGQEFVDEVGECIISFRGFLLTRTVSSADDKSVLVMAFIALFLASTNESTITIVLSLNNKFNTSISITYLIST